MVDIGHCIILGQCWVTWGVMHKALLTTALPEAVLWDMDGTLIDSEELWDRGEHRLAQTYGYKWTQQDSVALIGASMDFCVAYLQNAGVGMERNDIIAALSRFVEEGLREEVPWQPGAREVLNTVRALGVPSALVTASPTSIAHIVAQEWGGFAEVIGDGEVTRGKPDPEPYLLAAKRLGVDITKCVVVEDSPNGITAGLASGAQVIGITSMLDLTHIEGIHRVDSVEQITPKLLTEVILGAAT